MTYYDIIGENFDIKAIQILLPHLVDKLGVEPSGDKVRDMVGFEAYEGKVLEHADPLDGDKEEQVSMFFSS